MLMNFDDAGSGSAVVLLHSGVCDRRMWGPQVAALRGSHRVVTPDLRGFGETALPPGPFSYAEDVVALLDHLDLDRAAVVGSSFGGRIALEVAASRPERVGSLLLLCPAYRGLEPTATARSFGEREDAFLEAGDLDAAVELNIATWLGPEASTQTRDLVCMMQRHAFEVQIAAEAGDDVPRPESVEVDPARISAPAVVVSGDLDMDHFRNVARHLAETIPAARPVTLPWAAHLPSLERPDETSRLIIDWL